MNTIQLIDRKDKVRIGKKVVVSTIFDCNINEVWQRIKIFQLWWKYVNLWRNLHRIREICRQSG